jgi:hypothetical protein
MARAEHGRFAEAYADLTTSNSGVLTVVPMILDYSWTGDVATVETTSCDSTNREYLSSFRDWTGTINANEDADSDALYAVTDGLPRAMLFYWNRNSAAGKRRYLYGPWIFSMDESGGVQSQQKAAIKVKAAGAITRGFA